LTIGGVQSWSLTITAELRRLGHDVVTWGPKMSRLTGRFDIGILANVGSTRAAIAHCDRVLNVSHGIIPDEAPGDGLLHAFTSEGVRDHWRRQGPIIRQPIDLQFWSPGPAEPQGLVRYSYRGGLVWLPQVADRLGMPYRHLKGVTHAEAREVLRGAACVLATGRAALEAAACGVPVVILDHRSAYQGPLLAPFGKWQMQQNYSGRGGKEPTPELVWELVDHCITYGSMRAHVECHHDARQVAAEVLACCNC